METLGVYFIGFLGIMLFVIIIICPYMWLFNCSYYLKEISKKLDNIERNQRIYKDKQ